jgi:hypothetical protein
MGGAHPARACRNRHLKHYRYFAPQGHRAEVPLFGTKEGRHIFTMVHVIFP